MFKKWIFCVVALTVGLFIASPGQAFDRSGTIDANASVSDMTIDLSSDYAYGEYPTQITLWSSKIGAAPTSNYVNATVYGQPYGSTGWTGALYLTPANGASSVATCASLGNFTIPQTYLIGHISGESWKFNKLKIDPVVDSSFENEAVNSTINYVVHGGKP